MSELRSTVIPFVPRLERNRTKSNVSLGMIQGNSSKLIKSCFWPILQIFKTKFLVKTLISQRNMDLVKRFMDHYPTSLLFAQGSIFDNRSTGEA